MISVRNDNKLIHKSNCIGYIRLGDVNVDKLADEMTETSKIGMRVHNLLVWEIHTS